MKLNSLQQKLITYLEPFPTEYHDSAKVSIIDRGKLKLSQTLTNILRRSRQGEPMIWDPWILKDGDLYRLYYLKGLEGQTPWWTISNICGAISTDLENWQDLGILLEPNPANDWESGRICAGCTYQENGIYYLFYSAGGNQLPHLKNEAIGLATSSDGINFTRSSNYPLLVPETDNPWYGRSDCTGHFHWRDPYVFKDEQTGNYYMFICASSQVSGNFQGCIALAVASQIAGPYKLLPPVITPDHDVEDWPYYHLERPQVIYNNNKYYLFYSCFKMLMNPQWLQKVKHKRVTNSSLYCYVSDRIDGAYEPINPDDFIVQGSEKTGMYGTNFLQTSTDPEEFIAYGWYHRLHNLAISPAFQVIWKNQEPQIQPNSSKSLPGVKRL